MDIQKRLQELENELIDFSCYEDQLNDKEELLNRFNKLKEAINYTRCCTELCDEENSAYNLQNETRLCDWCHKEFK
tara:strand:+ start:2342 stop:2569 length:228 start_codon:yes stop_codon:yes gene_type:complete